MEITGPSRRILRVEKEIRQIIGLRLLGGGFKEPLDSSPSVTRVSASKDLRLAKVFVSSLVKDDELELDADIKKIQGRASDFQKEIATKLRMKYCPKITFLKDNSIEKVLKIERLFDQISRETKSTDTNDSVISE